MLSSIDISRPLLTLLGILVAIAVRTFYRLFLDPRSKIPGPKLAAATHLYEFYYDVVCGGKFLFQIEKLHQQYGPIVRISPHEVHISDPTFFDNICGPSGRRREKDPKWVPAFALPTSMIATVSHDHHRFRRGILNNFFSKRSVTELCPMIEERVRKLLQRLQEFHDQGAIVQLDNAFSALTSDIIAYYAYGRVLGYLEDKDFCSGIRAAVHDTTNLSHINRFFPFLMPLMQKVPPALMRRLMPAKTALIDFQQSLAEITLQGVQETNSGSGSGSGSGTGKASRTIYRQLNDPAIPPEERTVQRMNDEGVAILTAGTETTGRVLTMAAFHLASDRAVWERLRTELKGVLPTVDSSASWTQLEHLPYLTAVVNESLRIAHPVIARFPRVAPDETLVYGGYEIPPGTAMSTSSYFSHRDPTLFPSPGKFDPERWLPGKGESRLDQYFNPFSRGSRICIGLNLAYAELYYAIAYFARWVDLELHDTEPEDLEIVREFIIGHTRRGDVHVYARLTSVM